MRNLLLNSALISVLAALPATAQDTPPPAEVPPPDAMTDEAPETLPPAEPEANAPPAEAQAPVSGDITPPIGYEVYGNVAITGSTLLGAEVHDSDNAQTAVISDIVFMPDGQIWLAVLDVGGFLGLNTHRVAVGFEELQIYRSAEQDFHVVVPRSADELGALPEYVPELVAGTELDYPHSSSTEILRDDQGEPVGADDTAAPEDTPLPEDDTTADPAPAPQ